MSSAHNEVRRLADEVLKAKESNRQGERIGAGPASLHDEFMRLQRAMDQASQALAESRVRVALLRARRVRQMLEKWMAGTAV